jgi:hypothetical protein
MKGSPTAARASFSLKMEAIVFEGAVWLEFIPIHQAAKIFAV